MRGTRNRNVAPRPGPSLWASSVPPSRLALSHVSTHNPNSSPASLREIDRWIARLAADERVALLSRVARGDGTVGAELMRRFRKQAPARAATLPLRTAGAVRARAGYSRNSGERSREKPRSACVVSASRPRLVTVIRTPWRSTRPPPGGRSRRLSSRSALATIRAVTLLQDLREIANERADVSRSPSASSCAIDPGGVAAVLVGFGQTWPFGNAAVMASNRG